MVSLRPVIRSALVMGIYIALSLALSSISFQAIQIRVAEMMTILPFFFPETIISLTLGCLIVNLFSPFGWMDIVGGTLCTFIAALLTFSCRRIKSNSAPYVGLLPPILINAIGVSLYLTFLTSPDKLFNWPLYGSIAFSIGLGQSIAVGFGGTILIHFIKHGKWVS